MAGIIALTNQTNVGHNQAVLGVAQQLAKNLADFAPIVEHPVPKRPMHLDLPYTTGYLIGSGRHCLPALVQYKKHYPTLRTIWIGHQIDSALWDEPQQRPKNACNSLDHLCVPQTELTVQQVKTWHKKLIAMDSMPHHLTAPPPSTTRSEINPLVRALFNNHPHLNLVILGGDGPNAQGQMQHFGCQQARDFAHALIQHTAPPYLVTNSPRTGQHLKKTTPDGVSTAFCQVLQQHSCPYHFETWQDLSTVDLIALSQPSTTTCPRPQWYLPGDSLTMVAEMISFFTAEQVLVYDTQAMNPAHHRHIAHLQQLGHLQRWHPPVVQQNMKLNPLFTAAYIAETIIHHPDNSRLAQTP